MLNGGEICRKRSKAINLTLLLIYNFDLPHFLSNHKSNFNWNQTPPSKKRHPLIFDISFPSLKISQINFRWILIAFYVPFFLPIYTRSQKKENPNLFQHTPRKNFHMNWTVINSKHPWIPGAIHSFADISRPSVWQLRRENFSRLLRYGFPTKGSSFAFCVERTACSSSRGRRLLLNFPAPPTLIPKWRDSVREIVCVRARFCWRVEVRFSEGFIYFLILNKW